MIKAAIKPRILIKKSISTAIKSQVFLLFNIALTAMKKQKTSTISGDTIVA